MKDPDDGDGRSQWIGSVQGRTSMRGRPAVALRSKGIPSPALRRSFQSKRRDFCGRAVCFINRFQQPMWLIMFARYPAPKPLSMFTTLHPLEQEFSMDRRAARPWKDAP